MKIKILIVTLITALSTITLKAQDPVFTQFYNTPLNLNPGLTGCSRNDTRFCFNSRLQWLKLVDPFQYYSVSFDQQTESNFSYGAVLNYSSEGYLRTLNTAGLLGVKIGNDACNNWMLSMALQAGGTFTNINKNKLLFADQINQSGPMGVPSAAEILNQPYRKPYFDISTGLIFTWNKLLIGASGFHLNEPDNSFSGQQQESHLPKRFTGHISYLLNIGGDDEVTAEIKPTLIYQSQGVARSISGGALINLPKWRFELGLWYKSAMQVTRYNSFGISLNINLSTEPSSANNFSSMRQRAGVSYEAEMGNLNIQRSRGIMEGGFSLDKNLFGDRICPDIPQCSQMFNQKTYPWMFF